MKKVKHFSAHKKYKGSGGGGPVILMPAAAAKARNQKLTSYFKFDILFNRLQASFLSHALWNC